MCRLHVIKLWISMVMTIRMDGTSPADLIATLREVRTILIKSSRRMVPQVCVGKVRYTGTASGSPPDTRAQQEG
jgi:hypothetical protein